MKSILSFIALLACSVMLAYAKEVRLSEPVQSDEHSETFGRVVNEWPHSVSINELYADPAEYLSKSFALTARVSRVCQVKGCFLIAQQGSDVIRVSFKDYAFFVPGNINDRDITLVGQLVARDISPAQAKHLSNDLGKPGSIKSGHVYEIVASSVRVSRS